MRASDCVAVVGALGAVANALIHRWPRKFKQIGRKSDRNTTGMGEIQQPFHSQFTGPL